MARRKEVDRSDGKERKKWRKGKTMRREGRERDGGKEGKRWRKGKTESNRSKTARLQALRGSNNREGMCTHCKGNGAECILT